MFVDKQMTLVQNFIRSFSYQISFSISVSQSQWDCNFEQNLCSWTQDSTDNFNWTRGQGPTGSVMTGPINDHTLGTGKQRHNT